MINLWLLFYKITIQKTFHNGLTKTYYSLPHLCMFKFRSGDNIRVLEECCSKVRSIVATYAVSAPGERALHHQPPAGPLLSTAPCLVAYVSRDPRYSW